VVVRYFSVSLFAAEDLYWKISTKVPHVGSLLDEGHWEMNVGGSVSGSLPVYTFKASGRSGVLVPPLPVLLYRAGSRRTGSLQSHSRFYTYTAPTTDRDASFDGTVSGDITYLNSKLILTFPDDYGEIATHPIIHCPFFNEPAGPAWGFDQYLQART